MRNQYEKQLGNLNAALLEMGSRIEQAIDNAIQAFKEQNEELARKAVQMDDAIDQSEKDIESLCMKLLLLQQPVAGDLRMISSIMKMITDMERIGDHASDISEITLMLLHQKYLKEMRLIPTMAEMTRKMVQRALDAFVDRDLEEAKQVIAMDDDVDRIFVKVKVELINAIHEDKDSGEQALDLLMIAKYLERVGDHAVNLAEWVVYYISGERVSHC